MYLSTFSRILQRMGMMLLISITFISSERSTLIDARVSDRIYSQIQSDHFCSRRLNSTHQMGCQSELGGSLGIVWIVTSNRDLTHILKTGPTPPYMAILNRQYFDRKNLLEFRNHPDRVAGVVFLDVGHDSKLLSRPFSPEDTCPNRYSGLYANDSRYKDCRQNHWQQESPISGLLYDDIPYPIFLINEKKSIDEIESCFNNHNLATGSDRNQATYPLCGMQLDSFMLASSDSETCLTSHSLVDAMLQTNGRRCTTVENQNIFAYYKTASGPLKSLEGGKVLKPDMIEPQSVVVLLSKLSSLSMFTEISPGADSTVTSIITQLAVAEALAKVRNSKSVTNSKRNIAFAFLDSEPFDYTGSSRMVYSMKEDNFPNSYFRLQTSNDTADAVQNINLTSIDYVINLDQLALYPNSETIFMHQDPLSQNPKKSDHILNILKRVASQEKVKFKQSDASLALPPTSVHEFIKYSKTLSSENRLMGLVLSNYGETYNNLFYNSIYDDTHNIYQGSREALVDHLAKVANFIAKSLFELAFGAENPDISVDRKLIEQMLECYLVSADCHLFTRAWHAGQQLPAGPVQTYKDPVKQSDDMNGAITAHLLSYFIGDQFPEYNLTKCYQENEESMIYMFQYANGQDNPVGNITSGVCIRSQVLSSSATSPAFFFAGDGLDPAYPAWTVSLNSIRNPVRLFLKPSPIYQWCVFIVGVVITILSFVVVHHVSKTISQIKMESEIQQGTST